MGLYNITLVSTETYILVPIKINTYQRQSEIKYQHININLVNLLKAKKLLYKNAKNGIKKIEKRKITQRKII